MKTKTKTETAVFILRVEETNKPAFVLGLKAYLVGGQEFCPPSLHLSENDGLSCADLFRAVRHHFPMDSQADSNGRDKAWVSCWNDEAMAEMGGRSFRIRAQNIWELDEDGGELCLEHQTFWEVMP